MKHPTKHDHNKRIEAAKSVLRLGGETYRTKEILHLGIHPRVLYQMRDSGVLEQLDRGLFRLASAPPLGNPDLVSVALKVPHGVICLISALAFHELTTQIPHEVYVALERGAALPRMHHPPVRIFWFSGNAFSEGIETHVVDGVSVRVYSPEKTLVDCFKYRNKIGLDIAVEALKLYRQRKRTRIDEIIKFARICHVEKVMRPYLEALL